MYVMQLLNSHLIHEHWLFPQNETHQPERHSSGA